MATVTLPSPAELTELIENRDEASVTIYLPSSPNPVETAHVRLALKNAVADAAAQLEARGVDKRRIAAVTKFLRELDDNNDFWRQQSNGLAVLAASNTVHTYKVPHHLETVVDVGDRWDLGVLLRSVSQRQDGYVVCVAQGCTRLFRLSSGGHPQEIDLELPSDLDAIFAVADNGGDSDQQRATGRTGERIEHRKFCKAIHDAVLERISDRKLPIVLAAIDDFASAYREVNSYPHLLEHGIDVHPDSLSPDELATKARVLLDEHYRAELAEWRERFGTRRANGLATSQLAEVARAATAAAVEELLYNVDVRQFGSIDELGVLTLANEFDASSYEIIDEIAARVYRSGGVVRGVHNDDLLDGSPVAAILRFPI